MTSKYDTRAKDKVLESLNMNTWLSIVDLVNRTGLSRNQVTYALKGLHQNGLIERKGRTRSIKYKRVIQATPENIQLECPDELKAYFKVPLTNVTVTEFHVLTGIPKVTVYRYVKKWSKEGMVQIREEKELLTSGKRAIKFRRVYKAVTFTDKGDIVVESVNMRPLF
jgi:DNA-binding IclR family transcriptional regulator